MKLRYLVNPLVCLWLFWADAISGLPAPTVAEILRRHIDAMGYRNFAKIQSLKMTGTYSFRGNDYPMTITKLRPAFFRLDLQDGAHQEHIWFDGAMVWQVDESRSKEAHEVKHPFVRTFILANADFEPPFFDDARSDEIELVGSETVDGLDVYHLKISMPRTGVEHWFLDQNSFRTVKRTVTIATTDGEYVQSFFYLDYEPEGGIMFPRYIERSEAHYVHGYEITAIELDTDVDAELFKTPDDTN